MRTIREELSGEEPVENFLSARNVSRRYNVSGMTINRWLDDERLNFPAPVYINRQRFWKIAELEAWEASLPRDKDRSRQAGVAA